MEKKNKTTKILMHDIPLRLIKVLNIICLTIPFAGCWYGYYSGQMKDGFYNRGNLLMIALFDCTVPFDQRDRFQRAQFMDVDPKHWLPDMF